jgi:hypothetical protein
MNYEQFFESPQILDNENLINLINSDKFFIKDAIDLEKNKTLVTIFDDI